MQISSANLLAAQQAAQAALAAKQAARAAPAFSLPDLEAGSLKPAAEAARPAATAPAQAPAPQPGSGSRLGQHINIVV